MRDWLLSIPKLKTEPTPPHPSYQMPIKRYPAIEFGHPLGFVEPMDVARRAPNTCYQNSAKQDMAQQNKSCASGSIEWRPKVLLSIILVACHAPIYPNARADAKPSMKWPGSSICSGWGCWPVRVGWQFWRTGAQKQIRRLWSLAASRDAISSRRSLTWNSNGGATSASLRHGNIRCGMPASRC